MSQSQIPVESSDTASGPSTTNPRPKGQHRSRLNEAGRRIIEDYWAKYPGVIPPLNARKSLLNQIKNCGNDFYESTNLTSWFKRRAQTLSAMPAMHNPQFPSLTKSVLDHLEILIKSTQSPSSDVIETWAILLSPSGATHDDVVNWVRSRKNGTSNTRLPTPANSATPERSPSLPSSSKDEWHHDISMKVDISDSPTLPPLSISTNRTSNTPVHYGQASASSVVVPVSSISSPSPVSPAISATDPNTKFVYHRQGAASSAMSPVSLTSSASAASVGFPATHPYHKFVHYRQGSTSSGLSPISPTSPASPLQSGPQFTNKSNYDNISTMSSASTPVSWSSLVWPLHSSPVSPTGTNSNHMQQEHQPRQNPSLLQAIVQGVADAAANPTALPEVVPTSPAEYSAMFAPYEKRMAHLIQVLEKS